VQLTVKDENSQTTTTTYWDPYFWRPASVSYPDGGLTSWTYNSETSTTTTVKMNSSQNIVSTTLLDGLGRAKQSQLNSDPIGPDYVDTAYDALGRTYTVSNPYRTTSDPTYGLTTYQYDALSRPTLVIPPDGSQSSNNVSTSYTNNCATVADQAAKKRTGCTNSLGYLTQVFEDPSGLNYETDYSVDPLGNILGVTQKGGSTNSANWHSRSYAYDYLSRLTQAVNPESGTVNYYYDANGYMGDLTSRVGPAPNQTGSSTVTTTYAYDLLHRITQKSYSGGTTPAMYYWYDVHPTWGATWVTNVVGRLVEARNQYSGTAGLGTSTVNSYDAMGRITNQWQQTPKFAPGGTNLYYSFDLVGNMLSASNGYATISATYDAAGRPSTVTSSLVDSQHPATLATLNSSTAYFPNSTIRNMGLGNGLTHTMALNNTLEPCRINVNSSGTVLGTCAASTPTGNLLDLNAGFSTGTANNGNVTSWSAVGQQSFNRTYAYDSLNRLYTMSDSISTQPCRGLSWNYDAWGNLTNQNVTAGSCASFQVLAGTNNQLGSPFTYDAAGNMTYDGSHHYLYDAENRLIQVDGTLGTCSSPTTMCYVYDANGRRVEHTYSAGSQDYLFDLQGNVVSDWTFSSGYTGLGAAYVYLGSQLLAQYSNGTTYFVTQDHLGSTRLLTGTNQSTTESPDYYPFGQRYTGDTGYTSHEFASTIWDPETGLDHADFRQYTPPQGRWLTPDPAGLAAVDPANPQSWNRYAYVLNNPLGITDPSGLCGSDGVWDCPIDQDPNGGYFGGNCTLDGASIPCFFAGTLLHSGAAAGCPNNNCDGFQAQEGPGSSTIWKQWVSTGTVQSVVGAGSASDGNFVPAHAGTVDLYSGHWDTIAVIFNDPTIEIGGVGYPINGVDVQGPTRPVRPTTVYTLSFIWPVYYGLGPAGGVAYVPSQRLACAGGLIGESVGRSWSLGVQIVDANRSADVLGGWSFSGGYNVTPFRGFQGSINSSGSTGGFGFGSTGASGSLTWSKCRQF
jgi:RHS repeat-associated protein